MEFGREDIPFYRSNHPVDERKVTNCLQETLVWSEMEKGEK
jgi:hypothetical protein